MAEQSKAITVQASAPTVPELAPGVIEQVLLQGDLSKLSEQQRLSYYDAVCGSLGLNKLTRPFNYLLLNGKLVLYATKDCTEQLRKLHGISLKITAREKIGDVYVVTAQAKMANGREDESTGAVTLGKAQGDVLANLYMKAETKAKRRVTLSICGLGALDETEVESIPDARPFAEPMASDATPETLIASIKEAMKQLNPEIQEKVIRRLAEAGTNREALKALRTKVLTAAGQAA